MNEDEMRELESLPSVPPAPDRPSQFPRPAMEQIGDGRCLCQRHFVRAACPVHGGVVLSMNEYRQRFGYTPLSEVDEQTLKLWRSGMGRWRLFLIGVRRWIRWRLA